MSHHSRFGWENLTPDQFEVFVYHLVAIVGYDTPVRSAGSGDRGRDVVAFLPGIVPGIAPGQRECVFQAKKVRRITTSEIGEELHKLVNSRIDTWVLVTTAAPSPEVRRWVSTADASGTFRFHIQAWWRDDLESMTRSHAVALLQRLPAEIACAIGLDSVHDLARGATLAEASARCRSIASIQIERHARGKYIPKLYVRRELQTRIYDFLGPESRLASETKVQALAGIDQLRTAIWEQIAKLRNGARGYASRARSAERELEKLRRGADANTHVSESESQGFGRTHDLAASQAYEKLIRETEVERDRHLASGRFRRQILKASKAWLRGLLRLVEESARGIEELPNYTYFGKLDAYRAAAARLAVLGERLDSMPRLPLPRGEWRAAKAEEQKREFGILDIEASSLDIGEHLHSIQHCLERLHKHLLLVLDRAGSGKTNLFCNIVEECSVRCPVVLIFGKQHMDGRGSLIDQVVATLQDAFRESALQVMEVVDELLAEADLFLPVFIDGINENRHLSEYDAALGALIEWASHHRVRVVVSCRDIYWEFFDRESWTFYAESIVRQELREFSTAEYEYALPQYFSYYGIDCELLADARITCRTPLILRFFCEAYGSPNGPPVRLGAVADIRLRELFDLYFQRKAEEIRSAVRLRGTAEVESFLFRLVGKMYLKATSVLLLSEIPDATGDIDLSSENSLYVRLLDEDIILEEQPAHKLTERRVTFVYEEFMEYLLARALLALPSAFGVGSRQEIFPTLDARKSEWVNARGTGEYVAQMLLTSPETENFAEGLHLMETMARGDRTWQSAFWAVIPKLHDAAFRPEIYDLVAVALDSHIHVGNIRKCISAISRYNRDFADQIGSVVLWSIAVPRVVSWQTMLVLPKMSRGDAVRLADELVTRLGRREWKAAPHHQLHRDTRLVEALRPMFTRRVRKSLRETRTLGGALLPHLWNAFPEHRLQVINGLFEPTRTIRDWSAEGLRYVTAARRQAAVIAEALSRVEEDPEIAGLLQHAALLLRTPRR